PQVQGLDAYNFTFPATFFVKSIANLNYTIVSSVNSAAGTLTVKQVYKAIPAIPPVAASGYFQITGGSVAGGGAISSVNVNGVEIYNTTGSVPPLAFTTDAATTAAALVYAINLGVSTPAYLATQGGTGSENVIYISDN